MQPTRYRHDQEWSKSGWDAAQKAHLLIPSSSFISCCLTRHVRQGLTIWGSTKDTTLPILFLFRCVHYLYMPDRLGFDQWQSSNFDKSWKRYSNTKCSFVAAKYDSLRSFDQSVSQSNRLTNCLTDFITSKISNRLNFSWVSPRYHGKFSNRDKWWAY